MNKTIISIAALTAGSLLIAHAWAVKKSLGLLVGSLKAHEKLTKNIVKVIDIKVEEESK